IVIAKGGVLIEQLNIVGKRSGEGFVAHKAKLVNALSRALGDRLLLMGFTIGRKGLLGYIKALSGSNIVKIVPSANGSASEAQAAAKRLKVVCGATTSYLEDTAWIGDKTPMTLAEIRVCPDNSVKPNLGSLELSEAISRVLPFTAKDEKRPVLQCVLFRAKEGKLSLVASDGFRLATVTLDYDDGEGDVLIHKDELRGIANALRKAKRVRLGFEASGDTLDGMSLIIDTEAIRYQWRGAEGQFPDYQKVIPTEFNAVAHLDTIETVKAVNSFKALSNNPKDYPIDLTIGEGKIVMANPDERGEAIISADTDGQGSVRVDGRYLAEALKACGGMVDFKLVNAYSSMLFANDGYQVVVMPLMTPKANEAMEQDRQAKGEAPAEAEVIAKAEEIVTKAKKLKRSRKREPVAVA
ncbi:MAG: DNA polymerase III subunit beta, partial [Chloroflexi bacterium]|nr:DNA polymerase III subunit beta [Chloroflexota bacterium]